MDIGPVKNELRKELKAKRTALSGSEARKKSEAIFERWRNRFSLKQVAWLHVFQSIDRFREVDTSFYFDYIRNKHPRIRLVVPVVDKVHDELRHAHVTDEVEMVKNRFGIPEPKMPVRFVYPIQMDMVLVPLLGFDEQGNRLGYGKGHYDRFLSRTRPECLKIGLAFELSRMLSGLPHTPQDVPLDFVVTEKAVYRCNENLTI